MDTHPQMAVLRANLPQPPHRLKGQRELIDLGKRFVVLGHTPGRAQSSGVALTETYAAVCTLKDGKLIRQREFVDHTEALEAAGLRE
jgi:ketosteroid isomerase-like protein